MRDTSFVFTMK